MNTIPTWSGINNFIVNCRFAIKPQSRKKTQSFTVANAPLAFSKMEGCKLKVEGWRLLQSYNPTIL